MAKPGIRGVPFRKVTHVNRQPHVVIEILECGHESVCAAQRWINASKRRCHACAAELEALVKRYGGTDKG
jgi:hypothetical protein